MVRQVGRAQGAQGEANAAAGSGMQLVDASTSGGASPSDSRKLHGGGLPSTSASGTTMGTMELTLSGAVAMQGSGQLWTDEERRVYLMSLHIVDLPREEAVLRFLNDAMAGSPLPSPWKLKRDKHGTVYFANQPADVVTWSHPLEPSLRELAGAFRVCSTLTPELRKTAVYALHETWEQEAKKQFSKWYSIRHESGRAYYCHRDTGDTMWEHPAEVVLPAHYLKLTSIEWLLDEAYIANTCATQTMTDTINSEAAGENARNMSEITLKPEGGVPSELDRVRRDLEQQLQKAVEKQRLLKRELTAAEVELRAAKASNEASRREALQAKGAQRMRRSLVAQLNALEEDGGEVDGGSAQADSDVALPPDAKGVLSAVQEVLVARERDMAKRLQEEASLQATLSRERDAHARLGQAHLELAAERAAERRQLQGRLRESDASNEALHEMLSKSTADLRNHTECAEEMAAQQQSLEQQLREAVTSKDDLHEELLKSQAIIAQEELLKASAIAKIEEEPSDEKSKLTDSELPCIHHALSCLQDAETAITTLEERLAQAEESSKQKEATLRAECNQWARQLKNRDDTETTAGAPASFQEESSLKVEPPVQQELSERNPRLAAQQVLESASASETLARLLKARRQPSSKEAPSPAMETDQECHGLLMLEESEDPCAVKAAAPTSIERNVAPDTEVQEMRGEMLKAGNELHAATVPDELLDEKTIETEAPEALVKELAEAELAFTGAEPQKEQSAAEAEQRLSEEFRLVANARDQCAEMSSEIKKAENSAAESEKARNDVQQQLAAAQERLKAREMAVSEDIDRRTSSLQNELREHHLRQEELKNKHEALQSKQENLSSELHDAASVRQELQQRLRSVDIDLLKVHARDVMGSSQALSAALAVKRDDEAPEREPKQLRASAVHGRVPFKPVGHEKAAGSGDVMLHRQSSTACSWITEETHQDGSLISTLTSARSGRAPSDRDARRARRALEDAIVLASRIQLLHVESARTQRKIHLVQGHVQVLAGADAQDECQPSTGGYPAISGKLAAKTATPMEALPMAGSQQVQCAALLRNPPGPSSAVTSISATPEASANIFAAVLELKAAAALRARLTATKEELLRLNASLNREVAALTL